MRYGDLIQFEPIESVIQLLDANRPDEAKKLVATYVISDDMAERISRLMVPQLSFDESVDHKGVLIVGNYGTGKSHLMSVLSLVAEDAGYAPMIRHPKVAEAVAPIAGRFKVLRIEVGGLQMPLRQIITLQLERFLEKVGVDFAFPTADKELNNKDSFEEMMAAFAEKFPNQGVLLVVDEFLEYLQSRRDHELVQDLAILRQIGEVTKHLKFRFVAGVQEAIYCMIMLNQGFIAGSANVETPDPALGDMPLVTQTRDAQLTTVLSNSFGFGGTNASLVLRRWNH